MNIRMAILASALLMLPGAGMAQALLQGDAPQAVVTVTCADLRADARARHPQCQPAQVARRDTAPRPVLVAETRRPTRAAEPRRKLVRMPWMIGVYQ